MGGVRPSDSVLRLSIAASLAGAPWAPCTVPGVLVVRRPSAPPLPSKPAHHAILGRGHPQRDMLSHTLWLETCVRAADRRGHGGGSSPPLPCARWRLRDYITDERTLAQGTRCDRACVAISRALLPRGACVARAAHQRVEEGRSRRLVLAPAQDPCSLRFVCVIGVQKQALMLFRLSFSGLMRQAGRRVQLFGVQLFVLPSGWRPSCSLPRFRESFVGF